MCRGNMKKSSFEEVAVMWNGPLPIEKRQELLKEMGWTFAELILEHSSRQMSKEQRGK